MTRSAYYAACSRQSSSWLARCAADPSPGMGARHIAIIRLVLRHRARGKAIYVAPRG